LDMVLWTSRWLWQSTYKKIQWKFVSSKHNHWGIRFMWQLDVNRMVDNMLKIDILLSPISGKEMAENKERRRLWYLEIHDEFIFLAYWQLNMLCFVHLTQDVIFFSFASLFIDSWKTHVMKELPEIPINRFQLAVLLDEEACRFRESIRQ